MRDLLYVHDYGQWHIVHKKPTGAPDDTALCGATYQKAKPHWASTAHWNGLQLVIDERDVHAACAVAFWGFP